MQSEKIVDSRILRKGMFAELPQKPPPSFLLDRFKALLNRPDGEEISPPSTEEIVKLYEVVLGELTLNSKPIITELTIIAGEQREHAEGIANAICNRIIEAPIEQKLPSLYLLDSIVKNIGRDYVHYFSSRLSEVFCLTYRQAHPSLHPSMRHLFGTWSSVFPPPVLGKIEMQLQLSSVTNNQSSLGASDTAQPTRGIHVNPKYLSRLKPSAVKNNLRGINSSSRVYGQNSLGGYDEFEDQLESPSSLSGPRSSTAGSFGLSSAIGDGFPRSFGNGANPSNQTLNYGRSQATGNNDEDMEWRIKKNLGRRIDHERPRALINAYGVDTSKHVNINKPIHNMNVNNKMVKPWQNTEEEEFDWKDMSSTLDRSRAGEFMRSSAPALGSDLHLVSNIKNSEFGAPPFDRFQDGSSRFARPPPPPPPMISRIRSSGAEALPDGHGTWPHLTVRGSNSLPVPSSHLHHLANPGNTMPNRLHGNYFPSSSAMDPRLAQGSTIRPSLSIHGGEPMHPLSSGVLSQTGSISQNGSLGASNQPPGGAYSGLISSLMAQGLISLNNQSTGQGPSQMDFDADMLKVRNESAISSVYGDLPRQCTTCGQRFKCQEEHSKHMDWHVAKNRMSKNHKQKPPSRKQFVSTSMWLSGAASLGPEAVPGFFLPTEPTEEKNDDEEMAVPADEDQTSCALCGEPFEDFYSDETEVWMYKGAVYMNGPDGSTDKTEFNPIVHAKCRPEPNEGDTEEDRQRKKMRT